MASRIRLHGRNRDAPFHRRTHCLGKTVCRVVHFEREPAHSSGQGEGQPKLLIVAPMSGHYATLCAAPSKPGADAEVHITDWADARMVPLTQGRVSISTKIDYVIEMCEALGPDLHLLASANLPFPALPPWR